MDAKGRAKVEAEGASGLATTLLLQMTAALVVDPPTELTVIGVSDQAGIVTLTGRVSHQRFRAMAEEIASGHPGVTQAVNDLEVVPSAGADNGWP